MVFRKTLLHAARVVAQLSARDVLARGSGEIVLDVGKERAVTPECQRTDARLAVGELGDDRVRGVERQAQIPHQVVKELRARGSDGPFDQAAQHRQVAVRSEERSGGVGRGDFGRSPGWVGPLLVDGSARHVSVPLVRSSVPLRPG